MNLITFQFAIIILLKYFGRSNLFWDMVLNCKLFIAVLSSIF